MPLAAVVRRKWYFSKSQCFKNSSAMGILNTIPSSANLFTDRFTFSLSKIESTSPLLSISVVPSHFNPLASLNYVN
jgi:hypothetical protein